MKKYTFKSELGEIHVPDIIYNKTSKLVDLIKNFGVGLHEEFEKLDLNYYDDKIRYDIAKETEDSLFEEDFLWLKIASAYLDFIPKNNHEEEMKYSSKKDYLINQKKRLEENNSKRTIKQEKKIKERLYDMKLEIKELDEKIEEFKENKVELGYYDRKKLNYLIDFFSENLQKIEPLTFEEEKEEIKQKEQKEQEKQKEMYQTSE